jgi:hypothetical protein
MAKTDDEIKRMVQDRVAEELPPGPIDFTTMWDEARTMIEELVTIFLAQEDMTLPDDQKHRLMEKGAREIMGDAPDNL